MFRSALSLLLSLLMASSALWAEPADQTAGAVKAMVPDATRNAQKLAVNDTLQWNDLLATNTKGRVRANLTDGSLISVGSNSQLRVVQHDAAAQQTSLELDYGKLRNQVVKITQPGGKYEVKTPNAVIGVIGTYFYVAYANGRTTVICYEGTVTVTPAAGAKIVNSNNSSSGSEQSVSVTAGQVVVVGAKPEASGMQSYSALRESSLQDTEVGEGRNPHQSHMGRTFTIIALGAIAGLTVGLTQANSSSRPCGCGK
ncbi:MAG TPA: FecR family protein [Terriglobales bacterium]|nr:FecR family protein [Terriglobales bacterium]